MFKHQILILLCYLTLICNPVLGQSYLDYKELKVSYTLEELSSVPSPSVDSVKAVSIDVTYLDTELLDMTQLLNTMEKYQNIEKVSIYYSFDEHTSDIRNALVKLKQLRRIRISIDSCDAIPDLFSGLKRLKQISISANKINSVPNSICQLEGLEKLDISSPNSTNLPEWIGEIKGLKELVLYMDKLTSLPESFGDLMELEYLYVESYKLQQISKSFGNLTSLEEIDLFAPELKRFEASFRNMDSLVSLDLYAMPLLKHLPKDLNKAENFSSFTLTNAKKLTSLKSLVHSGKLEYLTLTEIPFSKYIKVIEPITGNLYFSMSVNDFRALKPKQAQQLNSMPFAELGFAQRSLLKENNNYRYPEIPITDEDLQEIRKLLPNHPFN